MKTDKLLKIVMGVAIIVLIGVIGIMGYYVYTIRHQEGQYQQMQADNTVQEKQVVTEEQQGVEISGEEEKTMDFASLQAKENKDIYAWIQVEGTNIDYPILQHPTDDGYYLIHNVDGSYGYPACIYTERVAAKDFSDPVTVIYGHRMKNGTMFAQLHNFSEKAFFEQYGNITVYTPEGNHHYEVIAAFVTNDQKITYYYDFSQKDVLQGYLDAVYQMEEGNGNYVKQEIPATTDDHYLILETCTKQSKAKRYVVMAKEV